MQEIRKKVKWATSEDLVKSFGFKTGVQSEKLGVLNAVWDKELGHFSKYWSLSGVKKGVLYVTPRSAEIIRSLNKHFSRPWIKAVKSALR